jgi:hypothetical protein
LKVWRVTSTSYYNHTYVSICGRPSGYMSVADIVRPQGIISTIDTTAAHVHEPLGEFSITIATSARPHFRAWNLSALLVAVSYLSPATCLCGRVSERHPYPFAPRQCLSHARLLSPIAYPSQAHWFVMRLHTARDAPYLAQESHVYKIFMPRHRFRYLRANTCSSTCTIVHIRD